jgi:hypothetical protein
MLQRQFREQVVQVNHQLSLEDLQRLHILQEEQAQLLQVLVVLILVMVELGALVRHQEQMVAQELLFLSTQYLQVPL